MTVHDHPHDPDHQTHLHADGSSHAHGYQGHHEHTHDEWTPDKVVERLQADGFCGAKVADGYCMEQQAVEHTHSHDLHEH